VKFLIINADDFGYGDGVNRAVAVLHDLGVVTSASLMVNTPGTAPAVAIAAARPRLSLGLHVNFTTEADRLVEFDDPAVCRRELGRQLDCFVALTGRRPTHLNSHHHVHRHPACRPSFQELADEHDLPLRDRPPVVFKGGFYGQWEHGVSQKEKVSFEALRSILSNELGRGIYELVVHPGYLDARADYIYHLDRQWEAETLADPRLLGLLRQQGISLISYHELGEAIAQLERDRG
jgi:PTS system cellobiose-specific IIA component